MSKLSKQRLRDIGSTDASLDRKLDLNGVSHISALSEAKNQTENLRLVRAGDFERDSAS